MAVTLSQFVQYVKTLDLTPTDVMPQDGWIIYGDGNVLKRVNSNTIISSIIQSGFEVIDGTTVVPVTGYRRYRVLEAGTYAGITITQDEINSNWVYIVVDEGVSSKELEPKPDFGSTIRDWVNTEDGLVFPDVRHYDNKVFRVVEGETVIGTDIPGVSLKWLLLIEDTSSLLIQVDNNTLNIGDMSALAYGNIVEAINAALVASNGSLFLQNLIDVSIPSPADGEALIFNGSEWINKTITDALGYVPENTANKGAADGYAPLDSTSKIDPIYLTGFIPEIIEGTYVNATTFNDSGVAVTPESAKIYVDTTSSKAYRWGGTSFTEIQASPGTTDEVTEGSINKYFTEARVRATILSGISFVTETAINATDSILIGLGKLQAQISNHLGLTNNPHDVTAAQVGAETPTGAQTKANTAETNAKGYADSQDVITLQAAKDFAEPLNVPPIANLKVKVYNLDRSVSYEDYGGGGASLLSKSFTYTSGAQTFTADFDIVQVSSLAVGNSFLQEGTQYTVSGAVVTILDTLTSGAVIQLKYWKANAVNATNYTKAESDAQLVVFTPEIGIAFTGVFNFTKYQVSFANYTTAGSITLSAGANPLPLSVNKVLIKGGVTINLPSTWSKRGGAFSIDATQWNEIYVQYEAGYVTLVNTVLDANFQPIATTTAADTTAPTAPTGLAATKTDTTVSLTWTASTDAVGVISYNVYKGGVFYSNVASSPAAITGLAAETPYSFTVSALDAAGNQSAQSTALSVTTNAATAGSLDYTMDTYTGAALGYSLNKLRTDYAGPAIKVRRDGVNPLEQDIGFDANGRLDQTALTNFVGSSNGFVTVWYDQKIPSPRNATNTDSATQPKIVNAGVIYKLNGKPTIYFNQQLLKYNAATSLVDGTTGAWSSFAYGQYVEFGSNYLLSSDSINRIAQFLRTDGSSNSGRTISFQSNGSIIIDNSLVDVSYIGNPVYQSAINTGTSIESFMNGTGNGSTIINTPETANGSFDIGAKGENTAEAGTNVYISEIIHYKEDKSTDRVAIENSIKNNHI